MKKSGTLLLILFLLSSGVYLVPGAAAGERNQKTLVTFDHPVELPGTVLPAGTYVFKLVDFTVDRNAVQVLSEDERRIHATILTLPAYRAKATDETSIIFEERSTGEPRAIKKWFFPDRTYGQEFVYSKPRHTEVVRVDEFPASSGIAKSTDWISAEAQSAKVESYVTTEHAARAESEESDYSRLLKQRQLQVLEEEQEPEGQVIAHSIESPMITQLPRTGSSLPLLGLSGLIFLAAGFALRCYSRRAGSTQRH
jgi:LPXTG-motif cell wall-anchored protein